MSEPRRFKGLPTATVAGRRVPVATSLRSRVLGLALLRPDRAGAGLLLPRCRAVHTVGMRFALDIAFLARDGRVLRRAPAVGPGRFLADHRACAVLELPSCTPEGR